MDSLDRLECWGYRYRAIVADNHLTDFHRPYESMVSDRDGSPYCDRCSRSLAVAIGIIKQLGKKIYFCFLF